MRASVQPSWLAHSTSSLYMNPSLLLNIVTLVLPLFLSYVCVILSCPLLCLHFLRHLQRVSNNVRPLGQTKLVQESTTTDMVNHRSRNKQQKGQAVQMGLLSRNLAFSVHLADK